MTAETRIAQAEAVLAPVFASFDKASAANTERVLAAFARARVSDSMFGGTTGYGYDDAGRQALDDIYAEVFGAPSALVRIGFVNGTHAIACALFGATRPGQTLISAFGAPYDTLRGVIQGGDGTLQQHGVRYVEIAPTDDGDIDRAALGEALEGLDGGAVLVQRSRGYSSRRALSIDDMENLFAFIKSQNPTVNIVVDNCYGEFVETREPTAVGADLCVGSLIKNPGGGLAPCGGYVCGRADLVERAAARLTAPGIGGHCGATLGQNRLLFQGLFMAPHVVAGALKVNALAAQVLSDLGYTVSPQPREHHGDIILRVDFGTAEPLLAFMRGIQAGSPVDSFASPEPWPMPGYDCDVVMAAGAFVQGSSIELSADAPMRPPYTAYMQGGLTYEAGRACLKKVVASLC